MKYLPIYTLLLLFVIFSSCSAPENKQVSKINNTPFLPIDSKEHDPYATGTNTITTTYGPQHITRNILQDRKGNIWLATWEGIMRYDGQNFTNFTNKEKLRRFRVFSLLEDRKGQLWFGTIGAGIYRFDGAKFTNFTAKEGLASDKQGCIYEDNKGHIWFGTMGGISVYDGATFRNFTTEDGLVDEDINAIIQDKKGIFWIGTRGAACTYDGQNFTKLTRKNGQAFGNVRSIIRDQADNIWLGGNDGLWRYDGKEFIQLSTNFTGYIYEDSQGNIWTSSETNDSGNWVLSRYDKRPLPFELPIATPILEKEDMFFGIVEDKRGGIWFGSLHGACRYDGEGIDCFELGKME